jgi:hypothetical protein
LKGSGAGGVPTPPAFHAIEEITNKSLAVCGKAAMLCAPDSRNLPEP